MRRRFASSSILLLALTAFTSPLLGDSPRRSVEGEAGGAPVRRASVGTTTAAPRAVPSHTYAPTAKEAYLATEVLQYIRPGLKIKVNSVTIGADRKVVADLSLTDDFDQPIDRLGKVTPGVVSISYILAWYDGAKRQYTAYTTRTQTSPITKVSAVQAGTDSGGTTTDVELGRVRYTFKTVLPEGFDKTKTHTLGLYATRNLTELLGKSYYANVEHDFRPDAAAVTVKWAAMNDALSCNRCHNPIAAHGGSRREVKLCVMCHQPQTTDPDTGETVDMKVMIHKIHRGANLPSVKAGKPYVIIGNSQSVHDFSHAAIPQDIRNCATCHEPTAADASSWYTRPTRVSCGSCHDDINWTTGENHPAGAQLDDAACASCHAPEGEREFDASIKGAHTIPFKSTQLKGLKAEIVSVDQVGPGKKPVVTFKLTNGDGSAVDPKPLGSNVNVLMAGPTGDYSGNPIRENASGATFNGTLATYTFTREIPATATGTWLFSMEVRRTVTLNANLPKQQTLSEAAMNPITYAAVTGNLEARRTSVDLAKCNTCHDRLALHGGQRVNTQECIACHNPTATDVARRPATAGLPESIDFKRLIHRIHSGEELTQDFTVYGFGNTANNYNAIVYPGDRRDCLKCHTSTASFSLPTGGELSTDTKRDWFTPMGQGTTACLGCHDNRDAAAHAFLNTAPFGEACATCHGPGKDWAVDKAHAR
jgi:OmcA/MtrC family decaheme c-type cytochrome